MSESECGLPSVSLSRVGPAVSTMAQRDGSTWVVGMSFLRLPNPWSRAFDIYHPLLVFPQNLLAEVIYCCRADLLDRCCRRASEISSGAAFCPPGSSDPQLRRCETR